MSVDKWSSGLITRLLEITHGQCLYCNFMVHDPVSGTIATGKKEELLLEIERQWDLGDAGLLDEVKYLAEVNMGDLKTTFWERQHYWLLAIKTVLCGRPNYFESNRSNNRQEAGKPRKGLGRLLSTFNISMRSEMFPKFHLWFASGKPSSAMLLRISMYTHT
jgi:hypothetical protein